MSSSDLSQPTIRYAIGVLEKWETIPSKVHPEHDIIKLTFKRATKVQNPKTKRWGHERIYVILSTDPRAAWHLKETITHLHEGKFPERLEYGTRTVKQVMRGTIGHRVALEGRPIELASKEKRIGFSWRVISPINDDGGSSQN